ncbi:hypothetical protein [Erythrobacter sp. HKB08]|uniref:hypothetical protein n=1 Tax=Erythrobacter sp. HKB08 TaxID=2502843 RepID=UPI001009135B|nr:hypothetical protein [Erythrobacter sp. HKB08]
MSAKAKSKIEAKELLIEIEAFEQSYHIADHRAEIGRVDDEAIIDIHGAIVRAGDHDQDSKVERAEVSLVCSEQYHSDPDQSEPQQPMLMTASVRKGVFQALAYLPPAPFWALPEMIASGRVTHVVAGYRTAPRKDSMLHALYFASHTNIDGSAWAHQGERSRS